MTIHILVGSTSGNTEFIAENLSSQLEKQGKTTQVHDLPDLNEVPTANTTWLLCIATHGAGEYGESIAEFMYNLNKQRPDLHQVKCAILSIGDSSYDTFCQAGIDAENLLKNLGATLVTDRFDIDMAIDLDPEASADAWLAQIINYL